MLIKFIQLVSQWCNKTELDHQLKLTPPSDLFNGHLQTALMLLQDLEMSIELIQHASQWCNKTELSHQLKPTPPSAFPNSNGLLQIALMLFRALEMLIKFIQLVSQWCNKTELSHQLRLTPPSASPNYQPALTDSLSTANQTAPNLKLPDALKLDPLQTIIQWETGTTETDTKEEKLSKNQSSIMELTLDMSDFEEIKIWIENIWMNYI